MAGYLIKETTCEERKQIVEEALGNLSAAATAAWRDLRICIRITSTAKKKSVTSTWNSMPDTREETWIGKKEEAARCQCKGKKIETISKERFGRRNWKENTI